VSATPEPSAGWHRRRAGPVEVAAVAALAVAVWLLTLGWDWSVVRSATDPNTYHAPQTTVDWTVLYVFVILAVGWLSARGRAVTGAFAVTVPLVALTGWRMAVATVIGASLWPVGLAAFALTLAAVAAGAALVGVRIRRARS
jgi:hypothetical protein